MPRTKNGEQITWSEFGKRWKQGIAAVTPLQQTKSQLFGQWIILIGIVWGAIIAGYTKTWWLLVILMGSLLVTATGTLGTYQKYFALKTLEEALKGGVPESEQQRIP